MLGRAAISLVKRVFYSSICFLLLPHILLSSAPKKEMARSVYHFEFLTFKAPLDNATLLEVWGEIPLRSLQVAEVDFGFQVAFEVSAVLLNSVNAVVARSIHSDSSKVSSLEELSDLSTSLFKFSFIVAPGDYHAVIQVTDKQSSRSSKFVKKIRIPDYEQGLKLSDLQLSDFIEHTEDESGMVKNNWKITPNPSREFGPNSRSVYVYSEIYNLIFGVSELEKGVLSYITILDNANRIISSIEIPNIKVGHQSTLVAKIPVAMLSSGRYELLLNVQDMESGQQVDKSAYFFVRKAGLVAGNL